MKNIFKRSAVYGLLVLFLASASIGFFPQAAYADYQDDGVVKRAETWVLATGALTCLDDSRGGGSHGEPFLDTISKKDASAGDWQQDNDVAAHVGEMAAELAEGSGNDDDKAQCDKVFKALASHMGVSMEAMLCGLGIYHDSIAGTGHCNEGGDFTVNTPEYYDIQSDKSVEVMKTYVENTYFGGNSLESSVSDAMKYYIFFMNFYNNCGNGNSGGFTVKPWDTANPQSTSSPRAYHLQWFQNNQVQDSYVITSDDESGESSSVDGYGLLGSDAENGGSDGNLGCGQELPDLINKYADAMKTALSASTAGQAPSISTDPSGTGATGGIDIDCGSGGSIWAKIANPLNWLSCSVLGGMSIAAKALDNGINGMLCINENDIFGGGSSTCDATAGTSSSTAGSYKKAWDVFRLIGLGLIAITGLIMVLSQTSGLEIFDAYAIRKTLPRLLVAAIGVTLSWQLMEFIVALSNVLGLGVRHLIYAPFVSSGVDKAVLGGGGAAVGSIFGLGALGILGALGVLSFVATGLLAILIAFFVLVIRNILVILLIIMAPIAIVAYALPNTEKWWKLWWEWFSKALLMFPIITAFIAVGHVFAAIASKQGGFVSGIVAMIAYFAPYFLLPMTFRLAGGALATIGGMANDRGRGAFDRLKNYRGAKAKDRFARAQNSSLWDETNFGGIGKYGNKIATWATDPISNIAYKGRNTRLLGKAGQKVAGQIEHARVEQSSKLFEEINKMGFNDKGLRALSGMHYGFSQPVRDELEKRNLYMKAPKSLSEIQQIGDVLQKYGRDTELIGGQALTASAGRLATLYQDPEMGKASIAAAGIMGLSAHGFATSRDLANTANALAGGGFKSNIQNKVDDDGNVVIGSNGEPEKVDLGNFDGGHSEEAGFALAVAGQAQLLGSRSRPEAKNGYGVMYDGNGKFLDGMVSKEDGGGGRMAAVLDTFTSQDLAAAKGGAIKTVRPEIERRLSSAKSGGEYAAMRDNLFSWAGPYSQASADVKVEAIKIIDKYAAADADFAKQWQQYQRMEDPEVRRARGATEDPTPPGGGGQQG